MYLLCTLKFCIYIVVHRVLFRWTVACLINIMYCVIVLCACAAKVYFERNHSTRAAGKAQSNYYILLFRIIKYAIQH